MATCHSPWVGALNRGPGVWCRSRSAWIWLARHLNKTQNVNKLHLIQFSFQVLHQSKQKESSVQCHNIQFKLKQQHTCCLLWALKKATQKCNTIFPQKRERTKMDTFRNLGKSLDNDFHFRPLLPSEYSHAPVWSSKCIKKKANTKTKKKNNI